MKKDGFFMLCNLFFAALFLIATINVAQANTFTVTRRSDRNEICNSGVDCSLREAVKAANASPTNDTINFNPDLTIIDLNNEIQIENFGALTINGLGGYNRLIIDGRGRFNRPTNSNGNRIFYVNGANVTITDVRLVGGDLDGVPFSNEGGAIKVVGGTLVLNRVHVSGNLTVGPGGGIYYAGGANHRILNSTISSNSAFISSGGGFYLASGTPLYVANTTISGNIARSGAVNDGSGGFYGSPILRNVTVTNNGGAVYSNAFVGSPDMRNTIVIGNAGQFPDLTACQIVGDNLFGNTSQTGCQTETILRPLQNNGGPTPTHELLLRSLPVDAGNNDLAVDPFNNSPLSIDQRGFVRIVDGNSDGTATVDIGAYESLSLGQTVNRPNVLINSSFEQGDAPWENWGNSSVVASSAAPNGNYELQIGAGGPGGRAQTVTALANTQYVLSAWGRVGAGETGWLGVFYLDSAGNQIAPQRIVEFNNSNYEQKQIELQTPPNTARLQVWAWKNDGTNHFYVDNIVLLGPPNLLSNPGFEQGDAAWQNWGNSTVTANPDAPSGIYELRIGTDAGGRSQTTSVLTDSTYLLSVWGRVETAGETGWIIVDYLDSFGNQIASQSFVEFTNTVNERRQITLQTSIDAAQLRVWTWKNAGAGYFYVDDFALTKQ